MYSASSCSSARATPTSSRISARSSKTSQTARSAKRNGTALWVYEQLSGQGGAHQRAVKHADLLIAAAAEAAGVAVLPYDEDYDRIAAITGQPTRWLASKGSLK